MSLPIDDSGDPVVLEIVDESNPEGVTRPYAEYCFAAFFLHIRAATGVRFPLRRLQFRHPRPPQTEEHERLFGCAIEFDAPRTRMLISREAWQARTTGAQAGVLQILAEHADLLLEKLPKGPDLVERTRKAIGQRLRGGDSTLEAVAAELAMSPRTLQRHLRELGYSFNALADEVRQKVADLYLRQPDIAIAEVAYLLGFSEQSAFNRAFRRWYGVTPKQYRFAQG